jgi:hypothetical protein
MANRLLSLFKKMFEPWKVAPITVTSPPSNLSPTLAGIVVRNTSIYSVWDSNELGPAHNDPFAALLFLANKGVVEIEDFKNNIIVRKLSDKFNYQSEETLINFIPTIGYIKLSDFFNAYNRNISRYSSAVKEDAIAYGLYNTKISSGDLTELGKRELHMWSNFRLYILATVDNKNMASQKIQEWVTYLPYAAEFFLGKAWIKMFAKLDAPAPKWLKTNNRIETIPDVSNPESSLKSVEISLIKMGGKAAEPYLDW